MIIPPWIKLAAAVVVLVACYAWGYHTGAAGVRADAAEQAVKAWVEWATLVGKLSSTDQQLATAQATIMRGVAVEVTKREVIYRDRIKDVATARCVADSGMLELIDASHGIDSAKH